MNQALTSLKKFTLDLLLISAIFYLFKKPGFEYFFAFAFAMSILLLGMHRSMIAFFDSFELIKLLVISILFFLLHALNKPSAWVDLLFLYSVSFIALLAIRLSIFLYRNQNVLINRLSPASKKNTIIIGAGEATMIFLAQKISSNYNIIGILDDNKNKIGRRIGAIKVLDIIDCLPNYIESHNIDTVLYMIPSVSIGKHRDAFCRVQEQYPKIQFLSSPSLNDINSGFSNLSELRNIGLLLVNETPTSLSITPSLLKKIENEVILVTGGAGSIGSIIVQQLLELSTVKLVIVVDMSEFNVYKLTEAMHKYITTKRLVISLSDYGDIRSLESILKKYKPNYIYHAAAYKHVNILQNFNIYSAVHNNCIKSLTLSRELKRHKCIKKFLLVSTDKAVNPSNIMGLTKRIVEILLATIFRDSSILFITVRFGNVVGSNGSVFHKFLHQIQSRQKITLTHRFVTRYFMNITQAANLIIKASIVGENQKIYILNMGKAIMIYDFILKMIDQYGEKKQKDDIVIVGLGPGEKTDEELYYANEKVTKFDLTMNVTSPKTFDFDIDGFEAFFTRLGDVYDEVRIKKYLKSIKVG
mgnify:CR=1 FL=1|tara:strand:+ start:2145 stop:3899 length:1755 start_codon:yes stop_codon:yes gene_type:complete